MNLDFFKSDDPNVVTDEDRIEGVLRSNKIDKKVLAAFLIAKADQGYAMFKSYEAKIRSEGRAGLNDVSRRIVKVLERQLSTYSYASMVQVFMNMLGNDRRVLGPIDVSTFLFEKFQITSAFSEDKKSVVFRKGKWSFSVPLKSDYPSFPANFKTSKDNKILMEMTGYADIVVLPFHEGSYMVATLIGSVMRYTGPMFDNKSKTYSYLTPKDSNLLLKTMPVQSRCFSKGVWNPNLIKAIISLCGTEEMRTELASANKRDIVSVLYVGVYKHFSTHMNKADYVQRVIKGFKHFLVSEKDVLEVGEDETKQKSVVEYAFSERLMKIFDIKIYAGAQQYMEQSRNIRGTDRKDISILTRNSFMGSFFPDPVSTAQKFFQVVSDIIEQEPQTVYYFGCSPGNALPMIHARLPEYVAGGVLNGKIDLLNQYVDDGIKVPEALKKDVSVAKNDEDGYDYQKAIYFYDLQSCNRRDYTWQHGDFFTTDVPDGSFVVSDIWTRGNAKEMMDFTKQLLIWILHASKGRNPVRPKEELSITFAVKFNLRILDLTADKVALDPLPTHIDWFYSKSPGELFLAKIGRPHNQEFLFTNYPYKGALSVSNVGLFKKALSDFSVQIFFYNHVRNISFMVAERKRYRLRGVVDIGHEHYPVYSDKHVLYKSSNYNDFVNNYFVPEEDEQEDDATLDKTLGVIRGGDGPPTEDVGESDEEGSDTERDDATVEDDPENVEEEREEVPAPVAKKPVIPVPKAKGGARKAPPSVPKAKGNGSKIPEKPKKPAPPRRKPEGRSSGDDDSENDLLGALVDVDG